MPPHDVDYMTKTLAIPRVVLSAFMKQGHAAVQLGPNKREFILTQRSGPYHYGHGSQPVEVTCLDLWGVMPGPYLAGSFSLNFEPSNRLASEYLNSGEFDFTRETRMELTKRGFPEPVIDIPGLTKSLGRKIGRDFFPGASMDFLFIPETSLWVFDDEHASVGVDTLLLSTALGIAKEIHGALGFIIDISSKYPFAYWQENFGAVIDRFGVIKVIPLTGSLAEIEAAIHKDIESDGGFGWD